MKLFKLIASKAGKVVFDDRIEAENPRTAREQMKSLLGLQSLTGVVYSITEIPVELIREIVATKVLEVVGKRRNGGSSIDVSKIVGDAANVAIVACTEAFDAANEWFTATQKSFPYATPWLEAELEETAAVMGEDFHPYGLERNRAQIDMFAGEAFRLGLTSRRITTEEYFADYLKGD